MIHHAFRLGGRDATDVRVVVGPGALRLLAEDLPRDFRARFVAVVADSRVAPLYARPLVGALRGAGFRGELLTFPEGESSKTRETKGVLEDRLAALGAGRDALVVAVGGGVTGDLAGFLAATWCRGVPVVQAPTSLLAMADAALGGKTAVNVGDAKNLVGAFHQPVAVYADTEALSTLDPREYRAGLAEVVKAAALADAPGFERLEESVEALVSRKAGVLERAIDGAIRVKARFVAADPEEAGPRAFLNFGHTAAHALEAASSWTVRHGEAVAIGLVAEARLAASLHGFPREDAERIESLLAALSLPVRPPPGLSREAVRHAARRDKKVERGRLRIAVPERLGGAREGADPLREVDEEAFLEALLLD